MADQPKEEPKTEPEKSRPKCHPRYLSFLSALVVSLLFYFAHESIVPLRDAEKYFVDYRLRNGRLTAPNTNLVYISVDRVTYDGDFFGAILTNASPDDRYFMEVLRGEFPWNREVFAEAVNKLANLGASKILLNFTFAVEKPEDPEFMATLNRHADKVVIGASFHVGDAMLALSYPSPTLIQPNELGEVSHDHRIGFVSIHSDSDGISRRGLYDLSLNQLIKDNLNYPGLVSPEDTILQSFSSRVMRSLERGGELPPPSQHPLLRYTGPRGAFETISLKSLFDPVERKANFERTGFFKDKTVIIGPGKAVLSEQYQTPFHVGDSTMDGSELHLNYLNAALQHELVTETSKPVNQALVLVSGVLLLLLTFFVTTPMRRILGGLVLAGIWLVIAFWQYNQHNLMIGTVFTPMLLLTIGALVTAFFDRPMVSQPTEQASLS